MNEIPIWVSAIEEHDGETKAIFRPDADALLERIPLDKLQANLSNVCAGLTQALADIKEVGKFRLQEVTIQVEVTAEGGVNLIGTATLGGKGAITLKFVE